MALGVAYVLLGTHLRRVEDKVAGLMVGVIESLLNWHDGKKNRQTTN